MNLSESVLRREPYEILKAFSDNSKIGAHKISRKIDVVPVTIYRYSKLFESKGMLISKKKGRISKIKLTPKGFEVLNHLEAISLLLK